MNRDVAIADLEHARQCVARVQERIVVATSIDQADALSGVETWLRQASASIDRAVNELRHG